MKHAIYGKIVALTYYVQHAGGWGGGQISQQDMVCRILVWISKFFM